MDSAKQVNVFERHGESRRFIRSVFLDEWLRYAVGRLPAHEVDQIHGDLLAHGKSSVRGGLGQQFEYEIVGR